MKIIKASVALFSTAEGFLLFDIVSLECLAAEIIGNQAENSKSSDWVIYSDW
jgi:hypothetical protein